MIFLAFSNSTLITSLDPTHDIQAIRTSDIGRQRLVGRASPRSLKMENPCYM
ncbi:hypothetical protein A1F99_088360 [Pyrenophora tritici-repentis]|nr:hypothetical protein A1F99_088360 [Pyrenophora tritici-repentis]